MGPSEGRDACQELRGDTESVAWESEGLLERDDVARPVLPGELLCFHDLRLRHVFGDMFLAFVSARLALRGSDVEPGVRGYAILGHTPAAGVHEPEVELREGVHEPENGLRGGVALLGVVLESSKGGGIVASLICLYRCIERLCCTPGFYSIGPGSELATMAAIVFRRSDRHRSG